MENTKNNSKLWFKAKRYGWGWTPSAWQGWMVLLVYLVSVLGIAFCLKLPIHFGFNSVYIFSPSIFILTIILIVICWKKGEKPGWRWGKDKS